jgi:hypothetical protein
MGDGDRDWDCFCVGFAQIIFAGSRVMTIAYNFVESHRTRNNARVLQIASLITSVGLLCLVPLLKTPQQKLIASTPALGLVGLSLLAGRDHLWADRRVASFVSAEDGGYRDDLVKAFRGNAGMGKPTAELEAEVIDEEESVFEAIANMEDDLASAILLAFLQMKISVTSASISSRITNESGVGFVVRLPVGVMPSAIVKRAADIQALAKLPVLPIISVASGGISVILPRPKLEAGVDVSAPTVDVPVGEAVAVEVKEVQSDRLPDGAVLVSPKALGNIDRYPVMMVVAGQGSGKTATMGAILHCLDGHKAIASPKPISATTQAIADLIFGFDPMAKQWLFFGSHDSTDYSDERDLSHHLSRGKLAGSMLEMLWACRRESMNRQLDPSRDRTPWRVFFDEASYTYTSGFNDPMSNGKLEKETQTFISGINKDAFQNFRGQLVQIFFGAQSKTVDSIGLKGFAAARDEAWFLFPGIAAITEARSLGKHQLANWMQRRIDAGFGVALLNKQDAIFEVINLPSIEVLGKFSK